jgi:hypothetical protein
MGKLRRVRTVEVVAVMLVALACCGSPKLKRIRRHMAIVVENSRTEGAAGGDATVTALLQRKDCATEQLQITVSLRAHPATASCVMAMALGQELEVAIPEYQHPPLSCKGKDLVKATIGGCDRTEMETRHLGTMCPMPVPDAGDHR